MKREVSSTEEVNTGNDLIKPIDQACKALLENSTTCWGWQPVSALFGLPFRLNNSPISYHRKSNRSTMASKDRELDLQPIRLQHELANNVLFQTWVTNLQFSILNFQSD